MGAREVNGKLMGKFFLMSFFMHGSGTEIAVRKKMSDTGKEISEKRPHAMPLSNACGRLCAGVILFLSLAIKLCSN